MRRRLYRSEPIACSRPRGRWATVSSAVTTLAAAVLLATSSVAVAEGGAADRAPLDRSFIVGVVGEPRGAALEGEALARRTHEVGLLLRCPVCQGSAVSDSPSPTAINMKNEVRDLLAQGFDQGQILAWFEASYGQFVLMEPKTEGLNLVVWLGPVVVLLGGLVLVLLQLRKLRGQPEGEDEAGEAPWQAIPGAGRGEGGPLADAAASASKAAGADPRPGAAGQEDPSPSSDPKLASYLSEVQELAYGSTGGEAPTPKPRDS